MDRCIDVEERLGRELTEDEIASLRAEVDRRSPRILRVAEQLTLELQPA